MVKSIQMCIHEAVNDGSVTPSKPIEITRWKTRCYTSIPQQEDNHSCGAYTLKYMLSWDGDEMTESFTQAQIDIFCYKVCSRLLRSDCNQLRKESYKTPITKEEYEASIAKVPNGAEDDVLIVSNPVASQKPKKDEGGANSKPTLAKQSRRKRGRPKKTPEEAPTESIKEQFATEKIAAQVNTKRTRKPSLKVLSPFKST